MNTQYFSKEQVEAGELTALLTVLMNQAYGKGNRYNDIRIHPEDCGAFSIEWVEIPWDHAYGGEFRYISEDETVFLERQMPNGTYEYFSDEDEYQERLKQLSKHRKNKKKISAL